MNEKDAFDTKGIVIDDINSLAEMVDQVILGNIDTTPEDEDDDTADYEQSSFFQYFIASSTLRCISIVSIPVSDLSSKINYPLWDERGVALFVREIHSPPPSV